MSEAFKSVASKVVSLNEEDWEAMKKILKLKKLKRNEHYLIQGEVCNQLGFIEEGYVRLYYVSGDKDITKDFSFENSFCGSYASFSSGLPSRFNVKAMEDCTLYLIDRKRFLQLIDQYPAWQKFTRISVENLFVRKELREASFLLDSPEQRYETLIAENKEILQRVPLKYIASYLGLTAETLSRIRGRGK